MHGAIEETVSSTSFEYLIGKVERLAKRGNGLVPSAFDVVEAAIEALCPRETVLALSRAFIKAFREPASQDVGLHIHLNGVRRCIRILSPSVLFWESTLWSGVRRLSFPSSFCRLSPSS